MSNKQGLIDDLKSNGKGERSWSDLAIKYGFSSGEAARGFWKKERKVHKLVEKQQVREYISDLEDRVVSLEEDLKNSKAELVYRSKEEIRTEAELVEKAKI